MRSLPSEPTRSAEPLGGGAVPAPPVRGALAAACLGALAAALGASVLALGWGAGLEPFRSVVPGLTPMVPTTGLCFALAGTGLALAAVGPRRRAGFGAVLGASAALIALHVVAQYATGRAFGTDLLLFPDSVRAAFPPEHRFPGRPALPNALALSLLGAALGLLPGRAQARRAAGALAALGGAIGVLALVGYATGLSELYGGSGRYPFTRVALHTGVGHVLLAGGVLILLAPALGWVRRPANWVAATLALAAVSALALGADARSKAEAQARLASGARLAVERAFSALRDAETGQRGFLLTGEDRYLRPHTRGRDSVGPALDAAAPLVAAAGGPAAAARLHAIRALAGEKLAELAETLRLARTGRREAALDLVRSGEGKRLMDALRAEVDALAASVEAAEARAQREADRAATLGALGAFGSVLLASLALACAAAVRGRAEDARRRADALLRSILETAPGLIYAKDRRGRLILANPPVLAVIGKPWSAVENRTDREFLDDPAQAEAVMANDRRVMESGAAEELEEVVGEVEGRRRVWLSTKTPLRDETGAVVGLVGVSVDITERKETERRLRLLVGEMNHRVKNTLATVQSIAAQTLRAADPADREAFEARIVALAAAHDVLTREGWSGASLRDVAAGVLAPHGWPVDDRFDLDGPSVRLKPRAVLALSMALHELTTNALKYGSLSKAAEGRGRVRIRWETTPDDAPKLRLCWTERGGPPVAQPSRRGFGARLVTRSLAQDLGGTARLDFEPEGVRCVVEAPLAEVAASAEVASAPRFGRAAGNAA
jgi:PAS domain S-box-containing protein